MWFSGSQSLTDGGMRYVWSREQGRKRWLIHYCNIMALQSTVLCHTFISDRLPDIPLFIPNHIISNHLSPHSPGRAPTSPHFSPRFMRLFASKTHDSDRSRKTAKETATHWAAWHSVRRRACLPARSRDGNLSLLRHHHAQNMVDPGRISGAELSYPFKYVGIQAHGHQLLRGAFELRELLL